MKIYLVAATGVPVVLARSATDNESIPATVQMVNAFYQKVKESHWNAEDAFCSQNPEAKYTQVVNGGENNLELETCVCGQACDAPVGIDDLDFVSKDCDEKMVVLALATEEENGPGATAAVVGPWNGFGCSMVIENHIDVGKNGSLFIEPVSSFEVEDVDVNQEPETNSSGQSSIPPEVRYATAWYEKVENADWDTTDFCRENPDWKYALIVPKSNQKPELQHCVCGKECAKVSELDKVPYVSEDCQKDMVTLVIIEGRAGAVGPWNGKACTMVIDDIVTEELLTINKNETLALQEVGQFDIAD